MNLASKKTAAIISSAYFTSDEKIKIRVNNQPRHKNLYKIRTKFYNTLTREPKARLSLAAGKC